MMKDKKHMVIAGVVVLAVVLVAGVAVMQSRTGKVTGSPESAMQSELKNGIGYGGSFDEFRNVSIDQGEDEFDIGEKRKKELGLLEDTNKNRPGETISDFNMKTERNVKVYETGETDLRSDVPDETDAEEVVIEAQIPIHESKGYEQDRVLCNAQSLEEAEEIAKQISGTLLSWGSDMAEIQITDSVDEFLKNYEQQGGDVTFYRKYIY